VLRLHRLRDHLEKVAAERAQLDLVPDSQTEGVHDRGRIVLAAGEAPVDRGLEPAAQGDSIRSTLDRSRAEME
jgi:hypothetical protein